MDAMEIDNPPTEPVTNGDAGTESSLYLTPSKRKHELTDAHEPERSDSSLAFATVDTDPPVESLNRSLKSILEVTLKYVFFFGARLNCISRSNCPLNLNRYDSELNFVKYPIPAKSNPEPDNKRTKLAEPEETKTIESKVKREKYKSLHEFTADVEAVAASMTGEDVEPSRRPEYLRDFSSEELSTRVGLLKRKMNSLLLRSVGIQLQPQVKSSQNQDDPSQSNLLSVPAGDGRPVLTVTVGNPPRIYFSSFQKTRTDTGSLHIPLNTSDEEQPPPLEQSTLPKEIKLSTVMQYNAMYFHRRKGKTRTIGEVFQSPSHLPQLARPKTQQPKSANVVEWLQPVDALAASSTTPSGQKLYNNKPLPFGRWQNYGRQKSQGQSMNDANTDEALFKSVYTSFAPAYDSSGGVVHKDIKNMAYWNRRGRNQLNRVFPGLNTDEIEPVRQLLGNTVLEPEPLDDASLRVAVESFDPAATMEGLEVKQKHEIEDLAETNADSILEEISSLLKTLHSYRNLRNLYPPPGKLAKGNRETFQKLSDAPSEEELVTYEALKQSLSSMIALLPPYAVSKLDGKQLAELNISTLMTLDEIDYAGTMEEDEWTLRQKQASRPPQGVVRSPAPVAHSPRTPAYQPPQQPNIAPHQRYQTTPRTRNASTTSQAPQAYNARPQPPAMQYPQPPHHPHTYIPTPPQPPQRYVQPPYQPPTPAGQYTRTGMLQQFQRQSQHSPGAYSNQRGPSPSQTPQPQQYPRPPHQPNFQPRPNAASSHRPTNFAQTPQRPLYMNSPAVGAQPRYFQQQAQTPHHFPNFPPNQASPVSTPYANNAAPMAFPRNSAEQAALIERTRTPLMDAQRRASGLAQPSPNTPLAGHQVISQTDQGIIHNNPPRPQLTPKP